MRASMPSTIDVSLDAVLADAIRRYPLRLELRRPDHGFAEDRSMLRDYGMEHGWTWTEGSETWTVPSIKRRWAIPRWTPEGLPVAGYELAGIVTRMLNQAIGTPHGGAPHRKRHYEAIRNPGTWHYYYCAPTAEGAPPVDAVYVDLRAAYRSIYRAIPTWDVRYFPGEYLGRGHVPMPFESLRWLTDDPALRNGIVGIAGATHSRLFLPNGRIMRRGTWRVTNYQWALLILHYLQAVMHTTRNVFRPWVHYVNTDGAIVDRWVADRVLDLWREWGLEGRPKYSGLAVVDGVGAWKVGDHISGHWGRVRRRPTTVLRHAEGIDEITAFLRARFRPIVRRFYDAAQA